MKNNVSINLKNNPRRDSNLPSKDYETTEGGKMADSKQNQP